MEQNFIENELVILSKQTLDLFLSQENCSDLISVYTFYYYTAKWQKTNQLSAADLDRRSSTTSTRLVSK